MADKKGRGVSNLPVKIQDVPDAPVVSATDVGTSRAYNNGAATVTIAKGTGGQPASYSITTTPSTSTVSGVEGANTITGLSSATSYTVNVTATNAAATSAAGVSGSFTATTVPQNPTIGTPSVATGQAYTGSANVSVPFTPGATGGSAISSYTVLSSSGNSNTGASSPITVSDTVGVARTYTVTATNANGTSTASSASAATTPSSVPQAPTIGTVTITGTTASVPFTANATGGSSVTSYTATSSPGSITGTGASSPISVSGLTGGTSYTFTVTATNANGTSAASSASNSVTASKVLSSWSSATAYPTIVAGAGSASVSSGPLVWGGMNYVSPFTYYSAVYSWNGSSWSSKGNMAAAVERGNATRTSATEAQNGGGVGSSSATSNSHYFNGTTLSNATGISQQRYSRFATSLGGNTFITGGGNDYAGSNYNTTEYRTGTGAFSTGPTWAYSGPAFGLTNGDFSRAYALREQYTSFAVYYTTTLNGAWTTPFNWPAWTSDTATTVNGDMLVTTYGGNGQTIYRMTDAGVFTSLGTISAGGNRFALAGNGSGSQVSIVGGYNGSTGVSNHYTATYA